MNDALTRRLLQIAADHHQQPMLMTKRCRIRPNTFLGAQEEEDYMEGGCDSMGDKTDVMNSKYDRDYGEVGVIELEEVIVVAPRKLNRWQVVKLEIQVNASDMVNDIRNDARQLGQWLKACLSGPMSLRGNRMSRGIGGMGIQFTSSPGKSGLTDTPVAAPGVEVITHNVDAWWDPFMTLWGPSFPITNSTPMVPDADGVDPWHGNRKMENDGVKEMNFDSINSELISVKLDYIHRVDSPSYTSGARNDFRIMIPKKDTLVPRRDSIEVIKNNDRIIKRKVDSIRKKYGE
ncbi:hypothetical protein [Sinomicrobium sp. M5D2P9]